MNITFSEVIDLTLPIRPGIDALPTALKKSGHEVEFSLFRTLEVDKIQVGIFKQPIHCGTHLDTPGHVTLGGKLLDDYTMDAFMGMGYCADVSHVQPNEAITAEMLMPYADRIKPGSVLLLYTGWNEKMFPSLEYWDNSPTLSPEAGKWIADQGVKFTGYDFFQEAGAKGYTNNPENFDVHHAVLDNGVLHCEHLTNLSKVVGTEFFYISLPLNIVGAEGSPTRAIALR